MVKVETYIKTNAPGSLYGEWAKKEECWNMLKGNDLDIELETIRVHLIGKASSRRRVSLSDSEIENKLIESELEVISSIPLNKWSDISKLTSSIEEVSQHLKDRAVNIMSTLKQGRQLSDRQRHDALRIIDTLVTKAPDFFNEIQTTSPELEAAKGQYSNLIIDQEFIIKMVEWDTKARVLTPNELQYLAGFAYGLSHLNDFHKQNIIRHLNRLINAGFAP
jgi:hypothetical protein